MTQRRVLRDPRGAATGGLSGGTGFGWPRVPWLADDPPGQARHFTRSRLVEPAA